MFPGFRLNATVFKNISVKNWVYCIKICAGEPCCRSINYKKTCGLLNEPNCEMLHDVVHNASQDILEINSTYHYAYLVNPQKVQSFNTLYDNILKTRIHLRSFKVASLDKLRAGAYTHELFHLTVFTSCFREYINLFIPIIKLRCRIFIIKRIIFIGIQ